MPVSLDGRSSDVEFDDPAGSGDRGVRQNASTQDSRGRTLPCAAIESMTGGVFTTG